MRCSVFDEVPGAGRWGSALLLDGNIGIGADPAALLERVLGLLRPDGHVLVEASPPGADPFAQDVHLRLGDALGPGFGWAEVGIDHLVWVAADAGLRVRRQWRAEGRWFAWLERHRHGEQRVD